MISKIIIEPISQHAEEFSKSLFASFTALCLNLAGALMILWVLKNIYDAVILGELKISHLISKSMLFFVVIAALSFQKNLYWDYVDVPIKSLSVSLVEKIAALTPKSTKDKIENSSTMILVLEKAVDDITLVLMEICSKAGIFSSILATIISAIIWIAFVAALSIFCLYWIGSTLKLAALGALSPFLILSCLFETTRVHAIFAVKYVLSSVLILIIASFCMGLILFAIKGVLNNPHLLDSSEGNLLSSLSTLFFVAWAAIYFLLLAPEMASTIMGSHSGSALPGIIGGAMAVGTGVTALTTSRTRGLIGAASILTSKTAQSFTRGASNIATQVRNRFNKNYGPANNSDKT